MALFVTTPCLAQEASDSLAVNGALRVYLDCHRCDNQYIRQQITFVNYVRDRVEAQVHLLVTTQNAGSGREYTLTFIGRGNFVGVSDTLRYVSSSTDTDEERRAGLAQVIRMGLARYIVRTPQVGQFTFTYDAEKPQAGQMASEDDPWNFWVFRVGLDGSYEAEESTNEFRFGGDLDVDRVTEQWKVALSLDANYRESNFDIDDETIKSTSRSGDVRGLVVRSLGSHWAAGGFSRISTSSFNNTDLSTSISPAVEYNVFPYSESTRREFRFSYFLNFRTFDYEEVTTFGKTSDVMLHHALEVSLESRQPWGSAFASLEGSTYLYDLDAGEDRLDLYRVELSGFVELRLVRGLSVFADAEVSRIRDQIFLSAEDASEEDILLRNRRLPTSYDYEVSLGFSYTFGSIFNNVVNSRFGS